MEISEACAADRIESIVMWRESPWLSFNSPQPQSRHIVLPLPADWPSAPGLSSVTHLRVATAHSQIPCQVPTAACRRRMPCGLHEGGRVALEYLPIDRSFICPGENVAYRILIADDSAAIRDVLREALVDEGYDVTEAASGDDVLFEFNGNGTPKPDLVLMDIRMPGKDGIEVLRALRASRDAELPIIVMTAFGSASTAIEAMKLGAFDYIAKPFELEEVTVAIERFFERQDLSDRVVRLLVESNRDEILIGDSPAMQDIYKIVGRVARSDATVLVSGETGTGKELVATVKKLLRVLQEREFERVGGTNSIKVDTRVVAATNKDLPREIDAGNFREDLYYRLNVIAIELPPLRERHSDIPPLVEHFLHKHRYGRSSAPARISQEAMSRLLAHDWPGNVRELENTIERAVIMARGGVIAADHVTFPGQETRRPVDVTQAIADGTSLDAFLKDMESRYLREALRQAGGNETVAAGLLGVDLEELRGRVSRTEGE